MKIRKNDSVKVLSGRDKGKSGKVLKIFPAQGKAIVEGINFIKRHARKTPQNPKGGIVQKEGQIDLSNLGVVCTRCNKVTRIGLTVLPDATKSRYCKKCKETI